MDLFGQLGAEQQADRNKLLASSSVIFSQLCGVKLGKKHYYLNPDQSGRNSLGVNRGFTGNSEGGELWLRALLADG